MNSFNGITVAKLSMLSVAPVVVANPFVAAKAELHPIVDVQSGYLFGTTAHGKWIKAEEAAKLPPAEATHRVYGLTKPSAKPRAASHTRCRFNQEFQQACWEPISFPI